MHSGQTWSNKSNSHQWSHISFSLGYTQTICTNLNYFVHSNKQIDRIDLLVLVSCYRCRQAAVKLTPSWWLYSRVTSEAQGQEKGFSTLECDVQQREEKHGPDDLWRKRHLQDGGAQLDVLTSCLHGDGSATSKKKNTHMVLTFHFILHWNNSCKMYIYEYMLFTVYYKSRLKYWYATVDTLHLLYKTQNLTSVTNLIRTGETVFLQVTSLDLLNSLLYFKMTTCFTFHKNRPFLGGKNAHMFIHI